MSILHRLSLVFLIVLLPAKASLAADEHRTREAVIEVETIASGLHHPWGIAKLPDGSFLVTERRGRLWRIAQGEKTEILGVPDVVARGQGGLLDIEADEKFSSNRTLYFTWSRPGIKPGTSATALSRARLSQGNDALEAVETLFSMSIESASDLHFGSRVALAPDGKLFLTIGDRGAGRRAQNMQDHAGAVLRLNRDGSIPPDNPYANGGGLPELWSKGHRNPQGAAWDERRNLLWISEHGAKGGDEINRPRPGKNYGWPVISYGTHYSGAKIGIGTQAPGYEQPDWHWDPSIAPSGLAIYYGDLFPQWRGNLLAGALRHRLLMRLIVENGKITRQEPMLENQYGRIRDVAIFDDGAVYLLTDQRNGSILRLIPKGLRPFETPQGVKTP